MAAHLSNLSLHKPTLRDGSSKRCCLALGRVEAWICCTYFCTTCMVTVGMEERVNADAMF